MGLILVTTSIGNLYLQLHLPTCNYTYLACLQHCCFSLQIATLGFVTGSELGKDALECLSGVKILYEIYKRMNQDEDKLAALRVCS